MSCNGCRVLRKGCSETCILRSCLQWIESAEAQGHATLFVAKFFGRSGLMDFMSGVSEMERPTLFQSLLYEACGRAVNPVYGAVGLLWSGNWNVCEEAVETVLKGGTLRPFSNSMPASPMPFASLRPYVAPPQTPALASATCKSNKTWGCRIEAKRRMREMGTPKKKEAVLGQFVTPVSVTERPGMQNILESANNTPFICSDYVELDLTLNPYPTTTIRAGRVASPNSTISVNSEASSTTQLPTLQWLSPPHQKHKLLHLLV